MYISLLLITSLDFHLRSFSGVNAAFEDVEVLGKSIEATKGNMSAALEKYSRDRAKEAEALVSLSRSFDRPGFLSVILFIIPIVLDSISHKILPQLFAANTIRLMQDGRLTFSYVSLNQKNSTSIQERRRTVLSFLKKKK